MRSLMTIIFVSRLWTAEQNYKTNDKIISLKSYDLSILGKRYNNGVWENIEQPESEAEPGNNTA